MHRVAWLVLLVGCRIGFDEIRHDGGDTAPSGEPFMTSCQPGMPCVVDCSQASSCNVLCNNASSCDVTCPPGGCTVTSCYAPLCNVDCADGTPPTQYASFATCP